MSDEMEDEVFQRMECIEFHGIKYDVELIVNTDVMTIQVESCETCEQWIGKFDGSCKSCFLQRPLLLAELVSILILL